MEATMHGTRIAMALLLGSLTAGGCVTASPTEISPPHVAVLGGGASRYGTDARQVFDRPELRAKIRDLFGPDWKSTSVSGLSAPIPAYFTESSAPTELRIGNADWVALRGCMPESCARRHGLLLIGPSGDRLLARIDDGGYTREYGYGPGMVSLRATDRAVVDAAWRALSAARAGQSVG
jgi:hypothetical protein